MRHAIALNGQPQQQALLQWGQLGSLPGQDLAQAAKKGCLFLEKSFNLAVKHLAHGFGDQFEGQRIARIAVNQPDPGSWRPAQPFGF